jgi:hypothetical protein
MTEGARYIRVSSETAGLSGTSFRMRARGVSGWRAVVRGEAG